MAPADRMRTKNEEATHACACSYDPGMRTTIEITDEQRSRLLALAAAQGRKGFSQLVQEAIDLYLEHLERTDREARVARCLGALGSLGAEEAEALKAVTRDLRGEWR